jgi:hypothetical protein
VVKYRLRPGSRIACANRREYCRIDSPVRLLPERARKLRADLCDVFDRSSSLGMILGAGWVEAQENGSRS